MTGERKIIGGGKEMIFVPYLMQRYKTVNCDFVYRIPCRYISTETESGKPKRRAVRINPTSESKQARNKRAAQKRHRLLLFNNFTVGDYWVTLTYNEKNIPDPADAHKNIMRVLGVLRKRMRRQGMPFVYDVKTEAGERTRVHHHMFIKNNNAAIVGQLLDLWSEYGNVKDCRRIYEMVSGRLVEYYLNAKNHKDMTFEKFSHSRNMKNPEKKTRVYPYNSIRQTPRVPKPDEEGNTYSIIGLFNSDPNIDGHIYQSYRIVKNLDKLKATLPRPMGEIFADSGGWKGAGA